MPDWARHSLLVKDPGVAGIYFLGLQLTCCTLSCWGGLHALVTLEAISAGTAIPGRFNLAGQVLGERSDELQHLALQVGGWAKGQ